MEITKPNDILIASFNNPEASTYDLMSQLNIDNTSLYTKEEYKGSKFIQNTFKDEEGAFDDLAFTNAFNKAANHYAEMSDDSYIKGLEELEYSPFDITRPKDAKVFNVSVEYAKDYNPFKQLYSRTGVNSIDESSFSLRELAQQGKIYDTEKEEWLDESVNDRGLFNKFFGETLVYAQYDDDGFHKDQSGYEISHKKGDWKVGDNGELFVETLGDREIYGKQVLNPMDSLTTDGSIANKFDFFDSDSKESSVIKTTVKLAAEIAPLLIPGFGVYYGGVKAAVGLASVLPTFYKSFEGILLGENESGMTGMATAAEGYLSKFTASSTTDEAQGSMFSYESMAQMVGDIFSQIYEQRAAASLAKVLTKSKTAALSAKQQEYVSGIQSKLYKGLFSGKIDTKDIGKISEAAMAKMPELAALSKRQSGMAKALSLGYMALTSTGEIYGEALESGYDRRTAGFAALGAAAGQYGIMANNRMGDWFLDKTVGYNVETNKALMRKTLKEYLEPIQKTFKDYNKNPATGKAKLASIFKGMKNSISDTFNNPSVLGEALMKNAIVEGVEEVTEEMVMDATKGIVDTMSFLGLTKKKGSFNTVQNVFSAEGAERYLASLVGGILGGAMFEFHKSNIEPWLDPKMVSQDTKQSIYELVGNGETQTLIDEVNKQRNRLGNNYLSPTIAEGEPPMAAEKGRTQADAIADTAIKMIENIDGIMNAKNLVHSDDEIISKAMRDHIILKDLNSAATNDDNIGIEGLILTDFREASKNITNITTEVDQLKADPKNADRIKELEEDLTEYEKKKEAILSGEYSEKYFEQSVFYLSKQVSKDWLTADRVTFARAKYDKDYYKLPNKGSGITTERIDAEWKEYLDSNDLRKHIEVATAAYKELEGDLNPSLDKYIKSGYSAEKSKTLKNILDLQAAAEIYNTSTPENKEAAIKNYLFAAGEIEESTGKRILPWDVVKTDFADQIISEGLLVDLEGKAISNITDEVKDILTKSLDRVPAENLDASTAGTYFNNTIEALNDTKEEEINKLKVEHLDWETNSEVLTKIKAIEDSKLSVVMGDVTNTAQYKEKLKISQEVLSKKAESLGLIEEDIYLNAIINKLGAPILIDNDATLEEVENSTTSNVYIAKNKDTELGKQMLLGQLPLDRMIEILNDFHTGYTIKEDSFKKYNELEEKEAKNLTKDNRIFEIRNIALESVLKEIKSGNLDGELLNFVEKELYAKIDNIRDTYYKGVDITDTDLLDLIINAKEYLKEMTPFNVDFYVQSQELGIENRDFSNVSFPEYLYKDGDYAFEDMFTKTSVLVDNTSDKEFKELEELKEIVDTGGNFISNSLYEFLEEFELSLDDTKKARKKSIFKILKEEELSLFKASDLTAYLSEGIRDEDILQAINSLKLMKSVVAAMQTTEITDEDPYGFIASRQSFVAKNKITSDVTKLATVSSDVGTLMYGDLDRIEIKLNFLRELSKSNSAKTFNEQEIVRKKTNSLLLGSWEDLKSANLSIDGNSIMPDLSGVYTSSDSDEVKLMKVKEAFYNHHKNLSKEGKIELVKFLVDSDYSFINQVSSLGKIDKSVVEINNHTFMMSLVSSLVVSPRDFSAKMLKNLKGDFDKAPFFTQELAIEAAYASIVDPDIFSVLADSLGMPGTHTTDYITYVLGDAGTGKTSVVFKSLIALLKDSNKNLTTWFVAPHKDQSLRLEKDVLSGLKEDSSETTTLDKNNFFEYLGITDTINKIKDDLSKEKIDGDLVKSADNKFNLIKENLIFENIPNNLPNLIFIDEVTHFSAIELEVLNEYMKRVKESSGRYTKIIGAGDMAQRGAVIKDVSYGVNRVSGIFTQPLNVTVRAANNQKRVNNDTFSGLVNKSIELYETANDLPKVLDFLRGRLKFRYYKDNETINGDYIIKENLLDKGILKTVQTILQDDNTKTLGILVSHETEEKIKGILQELNVDESRVNYYNVNNIQGAESDYFIFATSVINDNVITQKLKSLYTYISRAKTGTIIIKDAEIADLPITNAEMDTHTEEVVPLSKEIIEEAKTSRINTLTELLDPNFDLNNQDFTFENTSNSIEDEEEMPNNIFSDDVEEVEIEEPFIAEKDDYNYMFHSFYNDLNVQVDEIEGGYKLTRNPELFSGLNYLFEDENTIDVTKEAFKDITNELVSLKYSILSNINNKKKNLLPVDNPIIFNLLGDYEPSKTMTELVLKKSIYSEKYNSPFAKEEDVSEKHLSDGDVFFNLYLKVGSSNNAYYIHLSAAPTLATVIQAFGEKSVSAKDYIKLVSKSPEIKELPIERDIINFATSTRFIKQKSEVKKYSLKELSNIPGIKFWDLEEGKPAAVNSYNLFPSGKDGFENFVKLYKKTQFVRIGDSIDRDSIEFENKLKSLYKYYKGRPYIAITFLNSAGSNKSQVKIVLLKNKTRNLTDIKKAAIDIRERIISKTDKTALAESDTLLGGQQVLDMLIDLAVEKPVLFKELFEQKFLDNIKARDNVVFSGKDFKKYFADIDNKLKKDIIGHIAYEADGSPNSKLRDVILTINKELNKYNKQFSGSDLAVKIKEAVLPKITGGKKVLWGDKFWNIFALQEKVRVLGSNPHLTSIEVEKYDALFNTLDNVFNYWAEKEYYYNVKIKPKTGGGYTIDRLNSDLDYLYTTLIPEGPRLLINMGDIFTDPVKVDKPKTKTKTKTEVVEPEIVEPTTKKEIPSIDTYSAELEEDSNNFVKGIITELNNFMDESEDSINEGINANWSNLYNFLEADAIITIDGNITNTKVKNLTLDDFNLYESGELVIDYNNIDKILGERSDWGEEFTISAAFSALLGYSDSDNEIWNCL